jgi:uncharacterized membrane protein (GlpM family)
VLDLLLRFVIGGLVVSAFAILGDTIKPESLGGVFSAEPTIALATRALTLHQHGVPYLASEARSMTGGAIAFFVYACFVSFILMRFRPPAARTAGASLSVWGASAFAMWAVWLRR